MLTSLALLFASTWTAEPSDDVWAYPHSSNPGGEEYMRVWGDGEKAINLAALEAGEVSHGYLRFKLDKLPQGELKNAKLVVYALANEELTQAWVDKLPLEAHALKGDLEEKKFTLPSTIEPLADLFGKSKGEKIEKIWKLTIDLLSDPKSTFRQAFDSARTKGSVGFALCSVMSPAESRSFLYKVVSKEGPKEQRPVLSLDFADQ